MDWLDCLDIDLLRAWAAKDLPLPMFADHIEEIAGAEVAGRLRTYGYLQVGMHDICPSQAFPGSLLIVPVVPCKGRAFSWLENHNITHAALRDFFYPEQTACERYSR